MRRIAKKPSHLLDLRSGCLVLLCMSSCVLAGQPAPAAQVARTKAEVDALIAKAGATPPDWFAATPLNYPNTLDLTWAKAPPKSPWTPSKWLGQYIFSVINENPGKWKEGVKLMHHVLEVNKADKEKLQQTMKALAAMYQNLLQDHARAAFWLRKAEVDATDGWAVDLATCYWKLGNKDMAVELLKKIGDDDTRHGGVIKLWADLGETATALKVAEAKAKDGDGYMAWLMAGEACRIAGRNKEALDYYERVLKEPGENKGDIKQSRERAKASIEALKVYDLLDLKRIPDGTYTSTSYGYAGPITVAVTTKASKITSVKVTQHHEKQYFASLTDTPQRIIDKQSIKGIDTFSSATITSEAIINATAKALSSGMK
ncbi:MAG TPA: FMN-binding protein [Planctomycetota bacterium]|jgi:uncharacterized protein with FMN-binding domain